MRGLRFLTALMICALLCGCAASPILPEPVAVQAAPDEEALFGVAVQNSVSLGELPEEMLFVLPHTGQAQATTPQYTLPAIPQADEALIAVAEEHFAHAVQDMLESTTFCSDSVQVSYCLTYRSDTLLSALLEAEDATGSIVVQPVTIDLTTGALCRISDFFSGEDTGWRGLLADIVSDAAQARELPLLGDVPPVRDDQLFYLLADGSIVLLYRPYEITTYQEGLPCFVLPMWELGEYLSGKYDVYGAGPAGETPVTAALSDAQNEEIEALEP